MSLSLKAETKDKWHDSEKPCVSQRFETCLPSQRAQNACQPQHFLGGGSLVPLSEWESLEMTSLDSGVTGKRNPVGEKVTSWLRGLGVA